MLGRVLFATALAAPLIALAACAGGGGTKPTATKPLTPSATGQAPAATDTPAPQATATPVPGTGGNTVAVSLVEFEVRPSSKTAAAGTVSFDVQNNGTIAHNFVVIKTDLADDALPIDTTTLSADISKLDVRGQPSLVQSQATQQVTVALPSGHYVLICNLPYHYQAGMHVSFSVQ